MTKEREVNLRKTYKPKIGLSEVVKESDGLKNLQLRILKLGPGETFRGKLDDQETALVILTGVCSVSCDGQSFKSIGKRREVFESPGYTVYIPAGSEFEVVAHTWMEAALGSSFAEVGGEPGLITPQKIQMTSRGVLNWRRDIWDLMPPDFPSQHLVVVEVITPPGNWSSVPPHKHEEDRLPEEIYQEEIYFYRLKPEQGFAMQRVYTDDGELDQAVVARNNDAVLIPKGYHPVAVAPGYTCYYLNFLAGKLKGMAPKDDVNHSWLKSFEAIANEWGPNFPGSEKRE